MDMDKYVYDLHKDVIKKINDFADDQPDDMLNEKDLTVPNQSNDINNKEKENHLNGDNKDKIVSFNSNKKTTFTSVVQEYVEYIRIDNLRKEVFFVLIIFLKLFFKERYDLNFDSFKCDEVFGTSIGHMKKILGLEIYQIFCFYPENMMKILNFIKNKKMTNIKKKTFFYFMTQTYEELYNRYILGDINFPLFKGGTVRICSFITLEKAILERKKKWKNPKKGENFVEAKIKAFEELSKRMINDIKSGTLERGVQEKKFITAVIDEFELWRNHFLENTLYMNIELEES